MLNNKMNAHGGFTPAALAIPPEQEYAIIAISAEAVWEDRHCPLRHLTSALYFIHSKRNSTERKKSAFYVGSIPTIRLIYTNPLLPRETFFCVRGLSKFFPDWSFDKSTPQAGDRARQKTFPFIQVSILPDSDSRDCLPRMLCWERTLPVLHR